MHLLQGFSTSRGLTVAPCLAVPFDQRGLQASISAVVARNRSEGRNMQMRTSQRID